MDIISDTNLALKLVKQEKFEKAEKIYKKILDEDKNNPIILTFLGYLYISTKQYQKAETVLKKSCELSPTESNLSGLGNALGHQGKFIEAINIFIQLIELSSKCNYFVALTNILSEIVTDGAQETAYLAYKYAKKALDLYPLSKEIMLNYSIACIYCGEFKEGETYCYKALNIDNKFAEAWNFLGFIFESLYLNEKEAQKCYKKSIRYGNKKVGYYNIAISYSKDCKYNLANKYFNKALKFEPNNQTIIRDKARNFLIQKNFKYGYKLYVQQAEYDVVRNLPNPWDGKTYKNKVLYVYPDLCYGDHIFFVRYLPFLVNKFKKVKMLVSSQLYDIFKNNYSKLGIEFIKQEPRSFDYSIALSRLPYYLKMDFDNIPYPEGYLKSEAKYIKSNKLKVGLCWEAGNSGMRSMIHRSININEFKPLIENDMFEVFSFQVGASNNDYKKYNMIDLGCNFNNFSDTAKALMAMDVLVSVDTSVANLAGALGLKTFLLLPYYSDWRWFNNTDKTEWYNSIKIFKQTQKNNWYNEIKRVIKELINLNDER